jgi:hypothetical protein
MSPRPVRSQPGWRIRVYAVIVTVVLLGVAVELMASTILLYRYRVTGTLRDGTGVLSTAVVARKALAQLGVMPPSDRFEVRREVRPRPFLVEDPYFGFVARPGVYSHIYRRRTGTGASQEWETLPIRVTVNPDGSRWVGREPDPSHPDVYILGNSFAFGIGVNDEQTFAYHLQMALDDRNVRLFALGGYGLVQSYLRFRLIEEQLSAQDVIVLGYADFYDVRSVAAPSRLRDIQAWTRTLDEEEQVFRMLPRAELTSDGEVRIEMISEDCRRLGDYCAQPDPDPEHMTRVSAALINAIARDSPARVFVLAMNGRPDNPIYGLLTDLVGVVSVLPEDVGYFIEDDVAGFDPHPGPYWHYAVFRRLLSVLDQEP